MMVDSVKHIPNEETVDALREAEMIFVIRKLLEHAVYDEEISDECIDAVSRAKKILEESSRDPFKDINKC